MLLVGLGIAGVATARAETHVEILETYPSGSDVALPRNANFYVHLRYSTDEPIRIWMRPFFHGKPANAGTNPSFTYTGSGEALGWFFLLSDDAEVDEIRIETGDGGSDHELRYPVRVDAGEGQAPAEALPEWVTRLRASDAQRQQQADEVSRSQPKSAGSWLFGPLFMLAVLALGAGGVLFPFRALMGWRGGWRLAAAVPAGLMSFVVLRLIIGVSLDPTSHNLWPFEILTIGGINLLLMAVLAGMRRLSAADTAT